MHMKHKTQAYGAVYLCEFLINQAIFSMLSRLFFEHFNDARMPQAATVRFYQFYA